MVALALLAMLISQANGKLVWNVAPGIPVATADGVPIPRKTLVKRGQVITLAGSLQSETNPPQDVNGVVIIRVGMDTRIQVPAKGPWKWDWDTTRERETIAKLSVIYRTSASAPDKVVKNCDATIVDSDPLTFTLKPNADGSATLQYVTMVGVTLDKPRVLVDGTEATVNFDGTGSTVLTRTDLASPFAQATIQVFGPASRQGSSIGILTAPSASAPAAQDLEIVGSGIRLTQPDDPFETLIEVPVKSTIALRVGSLNLAINGKEAAGQVADAAFHLDPRAIEPEADYSAWATAFSSAGRRVYSKRQSLDALGLRAMRRAIEEQFLRERERLRRLGFKFDLGSYTISEGFPVDGTVTERWTRSDGSSLSFSYSAKRIIGSLSGDFEDLLAVEPVGAPLSVYASGSARLRGNLKGVLFCTAKTVPFYAPATTEGRAEIGRKFGEYWNVPIIGPKFRAEVEGNFASRSWTQAASFLGPHHKKLLSVVEQSVRGWFDKLEAAEALRRSLFGSQSYNDVVRFTTLLNEAEAFRLGANRAIFEMRYDLGEPPRSVSITRWVACPASQDDVAPFALKPYSGFAWWNAEPRPDMYP